MLDAQVIPVIEQPRQKDIDAIQLYDQWDMIVIGGGITGAGVVREAARQGLKVLLVEQKDFSWGTSSRSSKMVHGGLRYLAAGNFKLTRHSVKERERLMTEAPGLVEEMGFCWLHYKKQYPGPFLFNTLLAIYDGFAGHRYRQSLNVASSLYQLPGIKSTDLKEVSRFADAVTDDSRLVLRVLKEAKNDGAVMVNYATVAKVLNTDDNPNGKINGVNICLEDSDETITIKAKVVVSATGAWADKFRKSLGQKGKIRPLRGSHLVIPNWRLPVSQSVSLVHPDDGRSMFVYPWEGMTVIGTTDLDNPELDQIEPNIQQHEVDYLIEAVNNLYPSSQITPADVVSTFAGVRPIVSGGALSPSSEKRDHSIWDDNGLISVSGGKLTTFRLIALDVLKASSVHLEGLKWKDHGQSIFSAATVIPKKLNELESDMKKRLLGFYGSNIQQLCECVGTDGWVLIPGTKTYWAQLVYAARYEQARHLDDLLLRRTRVGLFCKEGASAFKDKIKSICKAEMTWTDVQWSEEWKRYQEIWHDSYSLPKSQQ